MFKFIFRIFRRLFFWIRGKKYIRNVEKTKVMDFPYSPEPDL